MRMAARPASIEPSAHDAAVTRFGLRPLIAQSSGLSTTARMATPSRVRRNSRRRPKATATAASTVVIWSQVITRSKHRDAAGRPTGPGSVRSSMPQTASARPWNARSSASVTTSFVATDAPRSSRRITSTSRRTPMAGAHTPRVTSSASGVGQPRLTRSSQYTNARNMPTAPWAKLKTPEVM